MIATIYKDGEEINRIVADEAFAAAYCAENGYTYTMRPDPPPPPEPEPEYTETQLMGQQLTDLELLVLDHIAKEDTV